MKTNHSLKISILFLLAFVVCCGFGINDENRLTPPKAVVTGKIKNLHIYPECRDVKIVVGDYRGEELVYSDSIKRDGSFRIEFDPFITQDVKFSPIVRTLIVSPGDSIYIDIDFQNIGKVTFSGRSAKLNNDYHSYINSYFSLSDYPNFGKIKDEDKFLSHCDSIRNSMVNRKEEFAAEFKPEKMLNEWIDKYILTEYYNCVIYYNIISNYYFKKDFAKTRAAGFDSLLTKNEELFNEGIMCSKSYSLLNSLYGNIRSNIMVIDTTKQEVFREAIDYIDKKFTNKLFAQLIAGQIFYMNEHDKNTNIYDNSQKLFNEYFTYDFIKEPLRLNIEFIKNQRENYILKHNQIMESLGNSAGRVLFDSIVNANKGKVIFLDFWAIWCGPCIAGMPKTKEMQNIFKERGVEVIFVCLGGAKESHDKIVSNAGIDRNTVLCTNEENIDLTRAFKILAIPSYVLINRDGHIVESGIHLSPASNDTRDRIVKLL
ncbi:hypothetical protein MASR2M69_00850 [Bacteroidota bacterium]